ncbi:hypothetical protein [Methylocystis echinoides]|uniref:Uncharacterized protein n=1 Tax=Methylocystis echinoides TaxID=29468 RepID=A0A9W6LST8_9HYPH|nr:hypothetical protein [Methylocystis echinoides]GLI93832.1 hypothetical protein LMG27198_28240 [Methylocystis echinoides]
MPSKCNTQVRLMSVVAASVIAMMAGSIAARAQANSGPSQPTKNWADPGSLERAKAPPATEQAPAPQTGASSAADKGRDSSSTTGKTEEPKAASATAQKPNAVESDKLKELIRASEGGGIGKKAEGRASARHLPVHRANAHKSGEFREAARKKTPGNFAKKIVPSHIAYQNLPNKKDAPAVAAPDPQFDPFSGYRQPISAAY